MSGQSIFKQSCLAVTFSVLTAPSLLYGQAVTSPTAIAASSWYGIHVFAPSPSGLPLVKRMITESLAPMGINALILEVNYNFAYRSHPELSTPGAIDEDQARELAEVCRKHRIRLIPQFNCLGHQSWSKSTFALLTKYPELDETPNIPKDNPGIYCRSWCPLHPRVNEIAFALIDELIDAFGTDAFHVGMDEVFLIASDQCPRCKGKPPAELFAKAVNDYHRHLVGRKKQTMLMWGDRLLDGKTMVYGPFEASWNGTAPAIDRIPKDIIICDWHYGLHKEYPSVRYFQEKGFRVWPASWRNVKGAEALIECARRNATDRMIGHLFTTWSGSEQVARALLRVVDQSNLSADVVGATTALRTWMEKLRK
jgi:hypothetical protein